MGTSVEVSFTRMYVYTCVAVPILSLLALIFSRVAKFS